jgi:hypothetical protein
MDLARERKIGARTPKRRCDDTMRSCEHRNVLRGRRRCNDGCSLIFDFNEIV